MERDMIIKLSHSKFKAYLSLIILLFFIVNTSYLNGTPPQERNAARIVQEERDTPKVAVQQGEKKGGSGKKILLIVGGLLVLGGILYLVLKPSEAAEDTDGSILVNSSPEGADIYLDGNNTGKTTNDTLPNVPVGSHTVRLLKDGYGDWEETVTVESGRTARVDASLTAHTIEVTQPTSGTNWTHGEEVQMKWTTGGGQSQSLSFGLKRSQRQLSRAFHSSRLSRVTRANPFSRSPNRAERLPVRENPERNRDLTGPTMGIQGSGGESGIERGSIALRSPRINSLIRMNQFSGSPQKAKPSGDVNGQTLSDIKIELLLNNILEAVIADNISNTGSHSWVVPRSLPDASNYSVRVSCATDNSVSGESERFSISSHVGKIKIKSTPTGAEIWLDGQSTGKTTNATLRHVKAGNHSIKLTRERYQDWEDTVRVSKNTTTTVNVTLKAGAFTEDFDDGVADYFVEKHPALWTVNSDVYKFEGDNTRKWSTSHYNFGNFSDFTFTAKGNREIHDSEWGIAFRGNSNMTSFYVLYLYPKSGRWSIYRRHHGSMSTLILTNSGHIKRAVNAWNEIQIEARGEEFTVRINGNYVDTITIPGIPSTGKVGLVTVTSIDFVKFDDLSLSLPTTGQAKRK
jgi:hypothetical protein